MWIMKGMKIEGISIFIKDKIKYMGMSFSLSRLRKEEDKIKGYE